MSAKHPCAVGRRLRPPRGTRRTRLGKLNWSDPCPHPGLREIHLDCGKGGDTAYFICQPHFEAIGRAMTVRL